MTDIINSILRDLINFTFVRESIGTKKIFLEIFWSRKAESFSWNRTFVREMYEKP